MWASYLSLMRLPLLLLVFPVAVWSQPLHVDIGFGAGLAVEDGDALAATTLTASGRAGWATVQVRTQLVAPVYGSASLWEAAALVGPTWTRPTVRASVGVGVGVAGGQRGPRSQCIGSNQEPECFPPQDLTRLTPAVGVALAAEGARRLGSGVWLGLRGDANLNGARPQAGATVGFRFDL